MIDNDDVHNSLFCRFLFDRHFHELEFRRLYPRSDVRYIDYIKANLGVENKDIDVTDDYVYVPLTEEEVRKWQHQ